MPDASPTPPVALVVISDLEFGGAQRQVIELANSMQPDEFALHVCSLSRYVPLAERLRDRERRLHIVERRWHYDFTVVFRLAALIRRLNASVVHGFLFDAEIASRLAGRLTGAAVIGSERNTDYSVSRGNRAMRRLTRPCLDLVIANSRAGADFHSKYFGVPRERCRVVHNGVDINRFCPGDAASARAALGLTAEDRVVGMFASFKEQKNHPLLLESAKILSNTVPHLKLLFVGDELFGGGSDSVSWKQHVQAVVDELGLRNICVFAGNRQDVERFYPACDVTVLPSHFEGTPNAALESMACGVPVVATDVSDNRVVIPDGTAGFLVTRGDQKGLASRLGQLLCNPSLQRHFSEASRAWVSSRFSTTELARNTAAVYREAINNRRVQ